MVATNLIGTATVAANGVSVAFGFLAANPGVRALAGTIATTPQEGWKGLSPLPFDDGCRLKPRSNWATFSWQSEH